MKYAVLGWLIFGLFGCTSKPAGPRVIYLNKLDHEGTVDVNGLYGQGRYRYALIDNPPKSLDSLHQVILHYCDSAVNKQEVETHYIRYYIQFYRLSDHTKSYQKGREDFWDLHNDINQELEDYRGEYRYELCKGDSLHGQWTLEVNSPAGNKTDTLEKKCQP
ncbi:hypothetical protein [Chitinophaga sancti]|uniref:hypothetical protein n=1 Tax=Chitinophaga sancti TaxID=1004 RepID=UPI003F798861